MHKYQGYVAVLLASAILVYLAFGASIALEHPELITQERSRLWQDVIMVLVGGLMVFIAKDSK